MAFLVLVFGCAIPFTCAQPIGEFFSSGFLSPGNGFSSSSSSFSSSSVWAPGPDGKMHQTVQEMQDERIDDGQKAQESRAAVACIDGNCKSRVQRTRPAVTSKGLKFRMMSPPQDIRMPRMDFGLDGDMDMDMGMGSGMNVDMGRMFAPMTEEEAMLRGAGNLASPMLRDEPRFETSSNSVSRSYSYSNLNGKEQVRDKLVLCKDGKCRSALRSSKPEKHGDTTKSVKPGMVYLQKNQQTKPKEAKSNAETSQLSSAVPGSGPEQFREDPMITMET